jgi:hypothetical protein
MRDAEMQKNPEKAVKTAQMRRIRVYGVGEGRKSRAFGF